MSWPVVGSLIVLYWVLLFIRMRVRSRRAFHRAFDRAAADHAGKESFDVTVGIEIQPFRAAIVVFGVPIALVVLRFLISR